MPASTRQPAVLFDLDGTLTNPFVGITRSMQFALGELGEPVPDTDTLRQYIGPPLQVTFPILFKGDAARANEALRLYRQRYAEIGKFENELIPGIVDALQPVRETGCFLSVATSKLESYSRDIIAHFGLNQYFDAVHGSQLDGARADKSELIAHIAASEGLDPARTVMIGDRLHDVHGASKNGIPTIGVLWGFGDRSELEQAGAAAIAERPDQLPGLIASFLIR